MTNKERKVVFILIGVLLIVMIGTILITTGKKNKGDKDNNKNVTQVQEEKEKYTEKLADGTKLNNSSEFNKTKRYKDLEITDIQYTSKGGNSVLLANIKNVGSTTHKMEVVKITIIGENGETLTTLEPIIDEIAPGETKELNAIATADIANAKDFKIEAK